MRKLRHTNTEGIRSKCDIKIRNFNHRWAGKMSKLKRQQGIDGRQKRRRTIFKWQIFEKCSISLLVVSFWAAVSANASLYSISQHRVKYIDSSTMNLNKWNSCSPIHKLFGTIRMSFFTPFVPRHSPLPIRWRTTELYNNTHCVHIPTIVCFSS